MRQTHEEIEDEVGGILLDKLGLCCVDVDIDRSYLGILNVTLKTAKDGRGFPLYRRNVFRILDARHLVQVRYARGVCAPFVSENTKERVRNMTDGDEITADGCTLYKRGDWWACHSPIVEGVSPAKYTKSLTPEGIFDAIGRHILDRASIGDC